MAAKRVLGTIVKTWNPENSLCFGEHPDVPNTSKGQVLSDAKRLLRGSWTRWMRTGGVLKDLASDRVRGKVGDFPPVMN
jgi:hypothetical protein